MPYKEKYSLIWRCNIIRASKFVWAHDEPFFLSPPWKGFLGSFRKDTTSLLLHNKHSLISHPVYILWKENSWYMKEKLAHTFQDNFRFDSSLDYSNYNVTSFFLIVLSISSPKICWFDLWGYFHVDSWTTTRHSSPPQSTHTGLSQLLGFFVNTYFLICLSLVCWTATYSDCIILFIPLNSSCLHRMPLVQTGKGVKQLMNTVYICTFVLPLWKGGANSEFLRNSESLG